MSTLWQEIRSKMLHSDSKINLLIGINVAVYLIINVGAVLEFLFTGARGGGYITAYSFDYLALTAYLPKLAYRFWTPVTYMFMHAGFFHILFNMLWLYWMGQIFEEYLGNKRTIGLYLMGGLAGALFYVAAFNLIPAFIEVRSLGVVGASASVMAIVVATATLLPDYTISLMFIGPVKLKWLALFYVVIDFIGLAGANAGGEVAHLGGALLGYIYIKQLKKGNDFNRPVTKLFNPANKVNVISRTSGSYSSRSTASAYPHQDEIDRILDKISHTGYNSLNRQEKETLQRASKNNDR